MTTKEMLRCKDCAYLVEDDDGNWICDAFVKDIHAIKECNIDYDDFEVDEEPYDIDDYGLEIGFDPYAGCYTNDC